MSGLGLGSLALGGLLHADSKVPMDLKPRATHINPRAKAVIQFVMNGGPSQMDLFDPKPELTKRSGEPHPDGVEIHQPNNANVLMGSPFQFRQAGQSGIAISEALPQLATVADDLCMIRFPEGLNQLQTCRIFPERPVTGHMLSDAGLEVDFRIKPPSRRVA